MFTLNRILFVFTLSALVSCAHKEEQAKKAQQAIKVAVQEIAAKDQAEVLNYPGSIEADNTVTGLYCFRKGYRR